MELPRKSEGGERRYSSALEDSIEQNQGAERTFLERARDWYFTPREFERDGRLYELLGVKYVQKAVMKTIGNRKKRNFGGKIPGNYFIGEQATLENMRIFEKETRFNEKVHGLLGAFYVPITGLCLLSKDYNSLTVSGIVINGGVVLLNFALCMLQRYNRGRVVKAIERAEERRNRR